MVDTDAVGTKQTEKNQTCHWLVNGATLSTQFSCLFSVKIFSCLRTSPGNSSATERNVSATGGTSIIDYAGPAPPEGSGPHR